MKLGKSFGKMGAPSKAGTGAAPPGPTAGEPIGLLLLLTKAS